MQMNEQILHPVAAVEVYFQSPDGGQYNVELMNRTIDMCKLFSNKLYEPLVQIVFEILRRYGDMPNSCPVKAVSHSPLFLLLIVLKTILPYFQFSENI